MDEIEEIPVETVAGARPRTSTGDRLMVALAALALLAGVLIAGVNLLDALTEDAVAIASPGESDEAEQTGRPSRTPRPSPSPRPLGEQTVVPGSPPPPFEGWESSSNGWLEALYDVPVFASPDDGATQIRLLSAGEIVPAQTEPSIEGWLILAEPNDNGLQGWVQLASAAGDEVVRFYPVAESARPGGIEKLLAGPRGYLAYAWPAGRPSDYRAPMLGTSHDGEHWNINEEVVAGEGGFVAAWGPSGWIGASASQDERGSVAWISESYDGESWSTLGSITLGQQGWLYQLVGSDLGYMMAVDIDGFGAPSSLWFSPDGVTWQESREPLGVVRQRAAEDGVQLLATPAGFLAWSVPRDGSSTEISIAYSANGRTWEPVDIDEPWVNGRFYMGQAGDGLVALGRVGDAVHVWRSALGSNSMGFQRVESLEVAFDDAVVGNVVSDGRQAYAIGFQRGSGAPRIWTTEGGSWRSVPPPDTRFSAGNEAATMATVGPAGLVVVGSRPGGVGDNPVLWRLRPDGTWTSEAEPMVPPVSDPTPAECGPLPSTALEFVMLDPLWGPACFADAEMHFRAWSPECDWCGGSDVPADGDSAWLFNSPGLVLLPTVSDYINGQSAVIHPDLQMQADWTEAWIEVTGHYADPAAEHCADLAQLLGVSASDPFYYVWRDSARGECRQRFVVTSVEVVEGA